MAASQASRGGNKARTREGSVTKKGVAIYGRQQATKKAGRHVGAYQKELAKRGDRMVVPKSKRK